MPAAPAAERRIIPVQAILGTPAAHGDGLVGRAHLDVGTQRIGIRSTTDFPPTDGWSVIKGNVLNLRRERGDFRGRDGAEAGVGDGRNLLRAGVHHETSEGGPKVAAVDVDGWRAALAYQNLLDAGVPKDRLSILVGGAVNELLDRDPLDIRSGWNLACLPQAPGADEASIADVIDPNRDTLDNGRNLILGPFSVDEYGLLLNAAYLRELRNRVTDTGTDVQVTLSGRIPSSVRSELFSQTGWQVTEVFRTSKPPRQDVDTPVEYVGKFANELDPRRGEGFFEQTPAGLLAPISPGEAEERRQAAYASGAPLEARHHVFEYVAVPDDGSSKRTEPITVYEL